MSRDRVEKFLIKNKNVKFVAREIAKALDIPIQNIGHAIRKLTKMDGHYDKRFKKKFGSKKIRVDSRIDSLNTKKYTTTVPALYVWYEE